MFFSHNTIVESTICNDSYMILKDSIGSLQSQCSLRSFCILISTLTYTIVIDDNYICQIYILVSVVYVTVRVHLVRFKLIANKTDEH